MKNNLSIVLRYFLFWLLFFFLERLIFIVYFFKKLSGVSFFEVSKSFVVGLWMDASMAAYISAIPLLLLIIQWFIPAIHIPGKLLKWYNAVLVAAFSIICAFNFNIYREWGSKINYKALDIAFNSPNEAIASGASSPILLSLIILFGLLFLGLWLSKRIISYHKLLPVNIFYKIFAAVLLIALNFLAIRGGWQLSPINESMAYYSQSQLLNHAAINTEWALLRDILNNKSNKNPYQYFKPDQAAKLVKAVYEKAEGRPESILTVSRPNIVLIISESFTADLVKSLGGDEDTAPQMEKLASEGLLFDHIYASGDRTDKGVVAVLNGFPSQAIRSIMKINNKQEKLPSISESLLKAGYQTSFFYGGESEFFNMKSYLLSHQYHKIIDKASFDKKEMNSKWGAYDDAVYNKLIAEHAHTKQPFFSTLLTLTNHEPFEVPGKPHFPGENVENKFRSTAYYADSCLGAFINNAKKAPWFKNTLFIVVADHGHRLPKNQYEIYTPNRFRIPLLFFGGVVKPEFRGKRVSKTGSQTDIATTLLSQLKITSDQFKWSCDILNPATRDFAFFDWDNGFGVATTKQIISFDNTGKNVVYKKVSQMPEDVQLLSSGKAVMQQVFQDYLDY